MYFFSFFGLMYLVELNSLYNSNGPVEIMWEAVRAEINNRMLNADFGTLAKIKGHKDRSTGSTEASRTYAHSLALTLASLQVDNEEVDLKWPKELDDAVIDPITKKLTSEGINKLVEGNLKWNLIAICDAACTTGPSCDPRDVATPAECNARIDKLEAELLNQPRQRYN